jgi:hypothetical protein
MEVWRVNHGEVGLKIDQFTSCSPNKHIASEKVVPCGFADNADCQPVLRSRSSKSILEEGILSPMVSGEFELDGIKLLKAEWWDYVSPTRFYRVLLAPGQ